jgi:hypothetical protein
LYDSRDGAARETQRSNDAAQQKILTVVARGCMMGGDSNVSANDNPLARALAQWKGEGGSLDADWEKRAALIQEEERILHCLGAAVITRWNNLPVEVQRELFASATSLSDPLPTAELKKQIARFLHSHKDL